MTVYVDLVIIINFIIDFYILSGVKFLLKYNTKIYRIILGSFIGSSSIILLFFSLNNILFNLFKIMISMIMIYVSFGKKNYLSNLFYLYVISIVLGGSIYLINDSLGYDVDGILFINNGYSINLVIILCISPIIIILYVKSYIKYKKKINTEYDVIIKFKNNKQISIKGFLDTGNKLVDPYFNKPIVLVNKKYITKVNSVIYVPYISLNNEGLLKCIVPEYILVDDKKCCNCLIGISDNIKYDCILNERMIDL